MCAAKEKIIFTPLWCRLCIFVPFVPFVTLFSSAPRQHRVPAWSYHFGMWEGFKRDLGCVILRQSPGEELRSSYFPLFLSPWEFLAICCQRISNYFCDTFSLGYFFRLFRESCAAQRTSEKTPSSFPLVDVFRETTYYSIFPAFFESEIHRDTNLTGIKRWRALFPIII